MKKNHIKANSMDFCVKGSMIAHYANIEIKKNYY